VDPLRHEEHLAKLDAQLARSAEELAKLDALRAEVEALSTQDDREAEARKHAEHMAEMDRLQESLKQTQARLAQFNPETTVAQVRRWAAEEKHPNWLWAAYADLAQRLGRVEDRIDEMADSLRMIIGQLAALERQDHES
jgi:hypothetical protein